MVSVDAEAIMKAAEELTKHSPVDRRGSATVCSCGTWYNTMLDENAAGHHAMRKALIVAAPYIGADALLIRAAQVPDDLSDESRQVVMSWLYEQSEELRPQVMAEEP